MSTTSASIDELKASRNGRAEPIVFAVDGDVSARESLELLIDSTGWQFESFASGREFLSRPRALATSCLVLAVSLPDISGLDLQKIVAERIEMSVVFVTDYVDVRTTVRAMKAGAVDFLTKPYHNEVLLSAILRAVERSHVVLDHETEIQPLRDRYASLSRREREVMALVVSGRLNKEVGGELGISEITVQAHRGSVMRKMRADSLAGLVRMAGRLRLTTAPKG